MPYKLPDTETKQSDADNTAVLKTPDELIRMLAESARHQAADAPEWQDNDSVSINVSIGDLRAALAQSEIADTSKTNDILNDATTHRRQWLELFDDKIAEIAASEDNDVSYWEHEKRAFLRLMNQAAALQGKDYTLTSMPRDSRAHPAMTVFISPETKFSHDYDADELIQFLEDNGVHPALIEREHTVTGYKVTIESTALDAQKHLDLLGAFEAMKKLEMQPAKKATADVTPSP